MSVAATIPMPSRVSDWIDGLQAAGRYTFTREEVAQALPASDLALQAALGRLVRRGRIAAPRRGFYVIVPLEYRAMGAPPPPWWIDALMRWEEQQYYVGLLTAASIHGAAHQAPQVFQVVTDRALRTARAGRHEVQFLVKANAAATPTTATTTPTGAMRLSTPEATALDLVRYAGPSGQLDHVALVLSELAEAMEPEKLEALAQGPTVESATVQRLGYLLQRLGQDWLAASLAAVVSKRATVRVPLVPALPVRGFPADAKWKVIVNAEIEVDP